MLPRRGARRACGRIDQPARLVGKLVVTNVSKDPSLRLLGAKLLYIDMHGKPIPLEDKRIEPTVKLAATYGSQDRLDPGLYIPSSYRQETMSFGVSVGG